ncbi:MAG TPA: chorismate-binding protein [Jatrophihabitans sp.]|nr:chorismate-binding protein [Jatrophihabitans sp.]
MAELVARRLQLRAAPGDLLRALAGATELDTSVLVCLAGCWADDAPLICWNPVREVSDPALIGEPAQLTGARLTGAPTGEQRTDAGPGSAAVGGGWFGWWSYSGPSWFGYFEQLLRRDPDGGWWLESIAGVPAEQLAEQAGVLERIGSAPPPAAEPPRISGLTGTSRQRHLAAVEQAIAAIRAGQLYQANICARFHARLDGSPVELFATGLSRLAPDYAAFVRTPARTVVSFSPELFLHREDDRVRTAPIKGTRRRLGAATGGTPGPAPATPPAADQAAADQAAADQAAADDLARSAKERAENVMIVDLMRNDLSRVCRPGSVSTPSLLSVRPAPGVWHLVSEVTGRLAPGATDADLLAACFPPGSVTGAPKIRAQQLITDLEDAGRRVFTGAIGYLSPLPAASGAGRPGRAEFNVAIRTFEISGDRLELGVGGGITADSVPIQEWQECLVKATPLLALGGATVAGDRPLPPPAVVRAEDGVIETMLAVDGRIVALADHLSRLQASCLELYRRGLPAELARQLDEAVSEAIGRHRVRLRWGPGLRRAEIEVAAVPVRWSPVALHCRAGRQGSWRHKWADRNWLDGLERNGSWPLFTEPGPDGQELALETSRGNIAILCRAGVLRTPALEENILPGITRRRLLDAAFDRGWPVLLGPVLLSEVRTARLVLSLSSIRGVAAVDSLDGERLDADPALLAEIGGWLG